MREQMRLAADKQSREFFFYLSPCLISQSRLTRHGEVQSGPRTPCLFSRGVLHSYLVTRICRGKHDLVVQKTTQPTNGHGEESLSSSSSDVEAMFSVGRLIELETTIQIVRRWSARGGSPRLDPYAVYQTRVHGPFCADVDYGLFSRNNTLEKTDNPHVPCNWDCVSHVNKSKTCNESQ